MAANKEAPKEKVTESKYSREELIQNAKEIFNVNPEVVVGALYGNSNKELTISEVKKAMDDFLKRKVK